MARVYVTPELGEAIKAIRLQNKLTSKSLSEHIGKSPAYISKLEKGDMVTISDDELRTIFEFVSKNDESFDNIIEKIYDTLRWKYAPEEIETQVWFCNYDTVKRKLPIPPELIDEINDRMLKIGVEKDDLLSRINANESLSKEDINNSVPHNTWWSVENKPNRKQSIKINFDKVIYEKILAKQIDVSPYIFILSMAFYLIKIEKYGSKVEISDEQNREVMDEATQLLTKYKFYSLAVKDELLSNINSREEQLELLSSFDQENIKQVNILLSRIKFLSDSNIKYTNRSLENFNKNINWDAGFMMRLISMSFFDLDKVSYTHLKELLDKIDALIEEYGKLPEAEKNLETY